jgi:hypothetical protein
MAALLIAEEEDQKQAPPSKQRNSNKARKHRNRGKVNQDKLDTGSKGHDKALSGSMASRSGRRDSARKRDDMARDTAHHSKPDKDINAHGGEENAGLVFYNDSLRHNEPEGSIAINMQQVEAAVSVELQAGASHSGIEQSTITQAERQQQKERERKGKQRQRKRATTQATLEEALAHVDAAGASMDTLNMLESAVVSAKRILEHSGASCRLQVVTCLSC